MDSELATDSPASDIGNHLSINRSFFPPSFIDIFIKEMLKLLW